MKPKTNPHRTNMRSFNRQTFFLYSILIAPLNNLPVFKLSWINLIVPTFPYRVVFRHSLFIPNTPANHRLKDCFEAVTIRYTKNALHVLTKACLFKACSNTGVVNIFLVQANINHHLVNIRGLCCLREALICLHCNLRPVTACLSGILCPLIKLLCTKLFYNTVVLNYILKQFPLLKIFYQLSSQELIAPRC